MDSLSQRFTIDLCGDGFHEYTGHCLLFRGQNSSEDNCFCPHCIEVMSLALTILGMESGYDAADFV